MKCLTILSRIIIAILTPLLALFGLAACGDGEGEGDEYGSPYAEFHLQGTVVNNDGDPIPGIEIDVRDCHIDYPAISDANGMWAFSDDYCHISFEEWSTTLHVVDPDGDENGGEFLTKDQIVDLVQTEEGSDDDWKDYGTYEATDIIIELEEDTGDEEEDTDTDTDTY